VTRNCQQALARFWAQHGKGHQAQAEVKKQDNA